MRTLLCIVISVALAGCAGQQSTTQQLYAADQTFTSTMRTLTPLIASGKILTNQTDRDWYRLLTHQISDWLDEAETAAVNGQKVTVQSLLNKINDGIDKLLVIQMQHERAASPRPATGPAASNRQEHQPWRPHSSSHWPRQQWRESASLSTWPAAWNVDRNRPRRTSHC